MRTHWTSQKQEEVVGERRKQLDLLFQFANAELKENENAQIVRQFHDLLRSVVTGHQGSCPDLSRAENDELSNGLQKHLCARLNKVINNTKYLWEMPLWKMGGSLEFTVEAKTNRFHERFRLRKIKPGNELKALKRIIDLALIEIIRDLDFKPNRFRQCPRCKTFFYQPTEKKKVYCSIRCGDAVRLQKHRRERRKKDQRGGKSNRLLSDLTTTNNKRDRREKPKILLP